MAYTVDHLSLADHIISLNKIGEMQDRYQPDDDKFDQKDTSSQSSSLSAEDTADAASDLDELEQLCPADDIDAARNTSDSKVYLFYMRTVGWRLMLVYFIACGCYIVSFQFPCKYGSNTELYIHQGY